MSGFFYKIKSIWLYVVYGFAAVLFFLVLFFPDRIVHSLVINKFSEMFPGSGLSAEKIMITIPPGIELVHPVFSIKGLEEINVDFVRVRPSILSLTGISKNIQAEIRAFGGNAIIAADFKDLNSVKMANAVVKQVDLSKIPESVFMGYEIKGILDSEIVLRTGEKGYGGKFSMNVGKGAVSIPFLPSLDLGHATANVDGIIDASVVDIKKCIFSAGAFSGDASGKITVSQQVGKSLLNLTVNVTRKENAPDAAPNMMIDAVFKPGTQKRIVLTGTLDNPKYSFN